MVADQMTEKLYRDKVMNWEIFPEKKNTKFSLLLQFKEK